MSALEVMLESICTILIASFGVRSSAGVNLSMLNEGNLLADIS